jgi:hypothetical protein
LLWQFRRFRGRITDVARHTGVMSERARELMCGHGIDRRDFCSALHRFRSTACSPRADTRRPAHRGGALLHRFGIAGPRRHWTPQNRTSQVRFLFRVPTMKAHL